MTTNVRSNPLWSFSTAVAELVETTEPSVVGVVAGRSLGSGVIWDAQGLIVTAAHVVRGETKAPLALGGGSQVEAKVVGADRYADLALLKTDAPGLVPLSRGETREPAIGEFVLAMAARAGRRASATSGIVSGTARNVRVSWGSVLEDAVVTDARLNPGYSGGPLVDASGRLLGMNVAYIQGRGVAIPAGAIEAFVRQTLKDGRVRRGYLGVAVEPIGLPADVASQEGVGQDGGLLVRTVEEGSPAKAAGLAIGDVILGFAGRRVEDEHGIHMALSAEAIGKAAPLKVLRGGKPSEYTVTPVEAGE